MNNNELNWDNGFGGEFDRKNINGFLFDKFNKKIYEYKGWEMDLDYSDLRKSEVVIYMFLVERMSVWCMKHKVVPTDFMIIRRPEKFNIPYSLEFGFKNNIPKYVKEYIMEVGVTDDGIDLDDDEGMLISIHKTEIIFGSNGDSTYQNYEFLMEEIWKVMSESEAHRKP